VIVKCRCEMRELKDFRKANCLKQDELAEKIGVSRSFISQVEAGHSKMPVNVLNRILNNSYGWDISMLNKRESVKKVSSLVNDEITELIHSMRETIETQKELIQQQKDVIAECRNTIAEYRERLAVLESAERKSVRSFSSKGVVAADSANK